MRELRFFLDKIKTMIYKQLVYKIKHKLKVYTGEGVINTARLQCM